MKKNVRGASAGRRSTAVKIGASIAVGCVIATAGIAAAVPAQAAGVPTPVQKWSKVVSAKPIALSSPMVATLDSSGQSVVVGSRASYEYALHLSNGSNVGGWPVATNNRQVDSTASVLGSGPTAKLFWGEGTSSQPSVGGIRARSASGKSLWFVQPKAYPTGSETAGLMSSLAIGNLQSGNDLIGGSMRQEQ